MTPASAETSTEDDGASWPLVRVLAERDDAVAWRGRLLQLAHREILAAGVSVADLSGADLEPGVTCKLLRERTSPIGNATRQADPGAAGTETRFLDHVPLAALIVDRRAALLPTHPAGAVPEWLLVRDARLVQASVLAFQGLWVQAVAPEGPLAAFDAEMLRLLAAGLKDEAIGRHLRISSRTVLRRLDRLMLQLGARTRFQAGVLAARHGWVD